jgi:hypothetical protein
MFKISSKIIKISKFFLLFAVISFFTSNCGIYKKVDTREVSTNANERARKAVDEGRGVNIGQIFKRGTNYEFSTSNPMWRATLETLDFIPLTNVDYSGGVIISDWYSNQNSNESLKISIQFLSNEISANSIKITIFRKKCDLDMRCTTSKTKSKIEEELRKKILQTAALIEKKTKEKK